MFTQVSSKKDKTRQGGFFKAYVFFILALVVVAYGAYFLGKLVPTSPQFVENQYEKIYAENDSRLYQKVGGADLVEGYATRYEDSPANYPESPRTTYQPGAGSNTTIGTNPVVTNTPPAPNQNQNPTSNTVPNSNTTAPGSQVTINQTPGITTTNSNPDNLTARMPTDIFESSINKRISFQVPTGSQVKEGGTEKAATFTVTTPEGKSFTMQIAKVAEGCFDAIKAFAIDPAAGIDYRIIHEKKELALQSTYRALRVYEEYGTYTGGFGLRGNACIQTAVPTRVEIRTANYSRATIAEAFAVFETLITYLKV